MNTNRFAFVLGWIVMFSLLAPLSQEAEAAQVSKVKGRKVLVMLNGDYAAKGDIFYLANSSGKRQGIIKIMKVKGDKALAVLGKGQAQSGWTLEPRDKVNSGPKASPPQSVQRDEIIRDARESDTGVPTYRSYWGFMGGFTMDSMKLKNELGTSEMSGNGFSLSGIYDYELLPSIWFRGLAGLQTYTAEGQSGDNICQNKSSAFVSCSVDIMYLSFEFWGRYVFGQGAFRPYIAAGVGLIFPASKDSVGLDDSSITNSYVTYAGVGVDYFLSETMYIPVQAEYGLLPTSDTAEANVIGVRAGLGFAF